MITFYNHSDPEKDISEVLDYSQKCVDRITQLFSSYKKKVDAVVKGSELKLEPVFNCNRMGELKSVNVYANKEYILNRTNSKLDHEYYRGWGTRTPRTVEETCALALEHADLLLKDSIKSHEENIPKIENNKQIHEYLTNLMIGYGFPKEVSEQIRTSSRWNAKIKTITKTAGWKQDVDSNIKRDDGFSFVQTRYDSFLKDIEKYKAEFLKKEQEEIRKQEAEAKKIKDDKQKAVLIVKYGLDYEAGWDELLDAILEKDRYLPLAYGMECTRNNWADGFDDAIDAIHSFISVTEDDHDMRESLMDLIEDNDLEDGRIFRDCDYNYGHVYGLVNEEVYKDFEIVHPHVKEF